MPSMRDALKGLTRRITVQIIKQKVVDHESVQDPRDIMRASILILPMPPQKIAIKPEGQRTWKWWEGTSTVKLELGWYLRPDKDKKKLYEVIEVSDWNQARVYSYQFAESPR